MRLSPSTPSPTFRPPNERRCGRGINVGSTDFRQRRSDAAGRAESWALHLLVSAALDAKFFSVERAALQTSGWLKLGQLQRRHALAFLLRLATARPSHAEKHPMAQCLSRHQAASKSAVALWPRGFLIGVSRCYRIFPWSSWRWRRLEIGWAQTPAKRRDRSRLVVAARRGSPSRLPVVEQDSPVCRESASLTRPCPLRTAIGRACRYCCTKICWRPSGPVESR